MLLDMIDDNQPAMNKTRANQTEMTLALEIVGKIATSRRAKRLIIEFHGLSLLVL